MGERSKQLVRHDESSSREYRLRYVDVKRVDSATGSELSCRMVDFYQIVKITGLLSNDNFKSHQATYSIREANCSQWSPARTGIICSVRIVQVNNRARESWTRCHFWVFDFDVPYIIELQ